ncbi:hypothetical protein [Tenacibaculum geojense]|uniref:Uncharacterized protein n=1 Tax=Tenacibaculum geojense TaxID=915352 RepID=A0ABW3JRP4_9FLAO
MAFSTKKIKAKYYIWLSPNPKRIAYHPPYVSYTERCSTLNQNRVKKMNTYIIFGVLALIGIFALISWNSKRNSNTHGIAENKTKLRNREARQEKRDLKLTVSYDYGEVTKTISEKATAEIIKSTMESTNWNEFHIVQLEVKNGYKALHVSGSLGDDGLTSGFVTEDDHILLVEPLETVEQMTEILLDYLKGEEIWRNKYEYK